MNRDGRAIRAGRLAAGALAVWIAAGCAGRPEARGPAPLAAVPGPGHAGVADAFSPAALDAARTILDGVDADPPGSSGSWRPGDAVLLGLIIDRGPEQAVRFLKVESPARLEFRGSYTLTSRPRGVPPVSTTTPLLVTQLTLYDEAGRAISSTDGRFPMDCIGRGAYLNQIEVIEYLEAGRTLPPPPEVIAAMPEEERIEGMRRSAWMVAIAPSMGSNPALQSLLKGLVEAPPLLSMLFGVDVYIRTEGVPARAEPVRLGGREYPAATMSLGLSINNTPALDGVITAVPAVGPLHLCGGVTSLEARNPAHPERRVRMYLLAARRGPERPSVPAVISPGRSGA